MMPSRGLSFARSKATRLVQTSCRNLSSSPRPGLRIQSALTTRSSPWTRSPTGIIPIAAAIRHASTAPTIPPAIQPATTPSGGANSLPDLDTITLDNIGLDSATNVSVASDHIGFLSEMGLDYGYGPTYLIQTLLESAHIYIGMPWWGSILFTAVVMRAALFPLYLRSTDSMARGAALQPKLSPLYKRAKEMQTAGRAEEAAILLKETWAIRKRAGVKLTDQFMPIALQGVLGYCGYKLLRAMATLPVEGLQTGGFLWFQDLTMTDGFLLMPLIMAGSVHLLARLGGESGSGMDSMPPDMAPIFKTLMYYVMPAIIFMVMAFQPGAAVLWFTGTGCIGVAQSYALRQDAVRNYFNLAPTYKPKPGEEHATLLSTFGMQQNTPVEVKKVAPSRPLYQAPNLTRRPARTIDTTLAKKSRDGKSDGPLPGSPSAGSAAPTPQRPAAQGILKMASDSWKRTKEQALEKQRQILEERKRPR